MRAILWLTPVLCGSLITPRLAAAQAPPVSDPECQCPDGPHAGEWVDCKRAPAYCGSESSSNDSPNTGVPPIVTALVTFAGLLIAPTVTLELKRDPARILAEIKQAELAWGNYRDGIEYLELAGRQWPELQRQQRARAAQLDRDLRAADRPPPKLPPSYQLIPRDRKAQTANRWARHGSCTDVVVANDELIRVAEKKVNQELALQMPLPAGAVDSARASARNGLLGAAGPAKLKTQLEALGALDNALDDYQPFMDALLACQHRESLAASNRCINAVLDAAKSGPVKARLQQLLGKGTAAAFERAMTFAAFFQNYVTGIRIRIQKQAIAAARCLQ